MSAPVTPSQTIGPFFHEGLDWAVARRAAHKNDEWRVGGMVADANGDGVPDAMLEVWQPAGVFQRVYTDRAGRFAFRVRRETNDPAIAHVTVFARGLLHELRTRVYVGATLDELA
ncbi:MAG: protocatechuate 3,4-dioxygenase subunit alpha, partial [Vicinamibacterales bacterium]